MHTGTHKGVQKINDELGPSTTTRWLEMAEPSLHPALAVRCVGGGRYQQTTSGQTHPEHEPGAQLSREMIRGRVSRFLKRRCLERLGSYHWDWRAARQVLADVVDALGGRALGAPAKQGNQPPRRSGSGPCRALTGAMAVQRCFFVGEIVSIRVVHLILPVMYEVFRTYSIVYAQVWGGYLGMVTSDGTWRAHGLTICA